MNRIDELQGTRDLAHSSWSVAKRGRHTLQALLVAVLLIFVSGAASGGVLSGPVVNPQNGHHYYLLEAATWTESEAEAHRLGGHLATVRNEAENQFIIDTFAWFAGAPRDLWIGLNDAVEEDTFVWSSGEAVTFVPVGSSLNTDTIIDEDYVHIIVPTAADGGKWNDWPNNAYPGRPSYGVVEIIPPKVAAFPAIELVIETAAGRKYRVQYCTDAAKTEWKDLGESFEGDGMTKSIFDGTRGEEKRFYRVTDVTPVQ